MQYRCVASSPEGLVQQVAVSYLRHGYWFYVSGWVKPGKDPEQIDRKLIDKYQIAIGERERAARKQRGLANMQYIRYRHWFLLLATEGHHPFKQHEHKQIRDCRRVPIRFEGYSISYRRSGLTPKGGGPPKWHTCVRVEGEPLGGGCLWGLLEDTGSTPPLWSTDPLWAMMAAASSPDFCVWQRSAKQGRRNGDRPRQTPRDAPATSCGSRGGHRGPRGTWFAAEWSCERRAA